MNNAYKSEVVTMDVADREYILLTATAGNTLVKQVAFFHRDHNAKAILKLQKSGGSIIEINEVAVTAAESATLNTDVIALELGDSIIVEADHISIGDEGYASCMYVESTNVPSYPSILALGDVDPTPTDSYALVWSDALNAAVWQVVGSSLRVKTEDGSTDITNVQTIQVNDGTLTDLGGGVAKIDTGGLPDTTMELVDGNYGSTGIAPLTFHYLRIPDITQWNITSGIVAVSVSYVLPPHYIQISNITTGFSLRGEFTVEIDADGAGLVAAELEYTSGVLGTTISEVGLGVSTITSSVDFTLIKETEVLKFRIVSLGPPVASAKLKTVNLTVVT
jgi:hypothetical protein